MDVRESSDYFQMRLIQEALASDSEEITLDQAKALAHWSEFGKRGEPSPTRVTRTAWLGKKEQQEGGGSSSVGGTGEYGFVQPVYAAWNVPLLAAQLAVLLNGFCPRSMEDKHFVYAEGPDAAGEARLWFLRSWTGFPMLRLDIQVAVPDNDNQSRDVAATPAGAGEEPWSGEITGLTYEAAPERVKEADEETAKYIALEGIYWIFGIMLARGEVKQPAAWENLPRRLPRAESRTVHKAMRVDAEALSRLKPGMTIVLGG